MKNWFTFRRAPKPEPEGPKFGSLRIVPKGASSFGVERYTLKNAKSRVSYGWWEGVFGSHDGATLAECEAYALRELLDKEARADKVRQHNEAVLAHHRANPPRIVTLETLAREVTP